MIKAEIGGRWLRAWSLQGLRREGERDREDVGGGSGLQGGPPERELGCGKGCPESGIHAGHPLLAVGRRVAAAPEDWSL